MPQIRMDEDTPSNVNLSITPVLSNNSLDRQSLTQSQDERRQGVVLMSSNLAITSPVNSGQEPPTEETREIPRCHYFLWVL